MTTGKEVLKCEKLVEKGIKILDKKYGKKKWPKKIKVNSLNTLSNADCVIGQIIGDYCRHNLTVKEAKAFSSCLSGFSDDVLTTVWVLKLKSLKIIK